MCALLQHGALQLLMIWSFFINCTFKLSSRFQDRAGNHPIQFCIIACNTNCGREEDGGRPDIGSGPQKNEEECQKERGNKRERGGQAEV